MWRAALVAMLLGGGVAPVSAEVAALDDAVRAPTVSASAESSSTREEHVIASSGTPAPETFRLKQEMPRGEGTSMGAASLQMMAGLVVVLALILGLSWLVRRFNLAGVVASTSIKVSAALTVGGKEKILVIEVDNQRLLVGVTAQQITLLQVLGGAPDVPVTSDFANRMQTLLKAGSFK